MAKWDGTFDHQTSAVPGTGVVPAEKEPSVTERIEPSLDVVRRTETERNQLLASIAISLKRIADHIA